MLSYLLSYQGPCIASQKQPSRSRWWFIRCKCRGSQCHPSEAWRSPTMQREVCANKSSWGRSGVLAPEGPGRRPVQLHGVPTIPGWKVCQDPAHWGGSVSLWILQIPFWSPGHVSERKQPLSFLDPVQCVRRGNSP